jgi:hypothetical protein
MSITVSDFKLDQPEHIIRATDQILAQLLTAQDDAGIPLLFRANRVSVTQQSVTGGDSPFAILRIADVYPITTATAPYVIVGETAELVTSIVFSCTPKDKEGNDVDIQERGMKTTPENTPST